MSDTQSKLDRLQALIASHPDVLEDAARTPDLQLAAKVLARFAAAQGLTMAPEEVEQAFRNRAAPDRALPLDDETLDKVAGGHSPWCFATHGCYCFATH